LSRHPSLRRPALRPGLLVVLAAGTVLLAAQSRPAIASAPSPKLFEGLSASERNAAMQHFQAKFDSLRATGVDKIFPQFALDLAKYPRGGVAHRNILVILCQFPAEGSSPAKNPSPTSTPAYYQKLYFSDDSTDNVISLREYYRNNSRGRLIISGRVTPKWLTMPHSYDYYVNGDAGLDFGSYPRSAQKLAEDAMAAAYNEFGNDLSYFDNDGPDGIPSSGDDDGYIDAVAVVHAGQGGEVLCLDPTGCNQLWAHESGVATYSNCPTGAANEGPGCLPGLQLGSVKGFLYTMVGEYNEFPGDMTNGTYCHEFGHTLGLADLYAPDGAGLGFYSLMALGNYLPYPSDPNSTGPGAGAIGSRPSNLDPWSRQYLGFDDPTPVSTPGHYRVAPMERGGGSLRIWSNGEPGTEYFLVENRLKEKSDLYIPGQGMLVYHVDDTKNDNLGGNGTYRISVVQADGVKDLEDGVNYGDPGDFFPGSKLNRTLTDATTPNTKSLLGANTGIGLVNITGAADNSDTTSFDLQISLQTELRLVSLSIDDGPGGNGVADPNETIHLTPTIRNAGLGSTAIHMTLTSGDPVVNITQALVNAAPLLPGGSETPPLPWIFQVGNVATLPHDIPFTVNWSEDSHGWSGSFDFIVTVGLQSGLSENFDSGTEPGVYWSTESLPGSSADEWHASNSRAKGAYSAKLGSSLPLGTGSNAGQSYAGSEDAALDSPAFDLPPNSQLAFDSWIDAETFGGTECYDGGRVEISSNGGEWIPLAVDGGYGSIVKFDAESTLRGAEVFSGSPQTWRHVTADLSGYSGPVRIRFRFASDSQNAPFDQLGNPLRVYEGWYVDNVVVQPRTQTGPTPHRLALRGGPSPFVVGGGGNGFSGSMVFRFSAPDGLPHPELTPEVRIFDVHGRLIQTVSGSQNGLVPSEFRAYWNAHDQSGNLVPSGVYFAKTDIQGKAESFRIVLFR